MASGRMRVLGPDAAIMRRREMEDRLNNAKHFLHEQKKANLVAQWEDKSKEREIALDRARLAEEQEAERQAEMDRRRAKLAQKLHKEEQQYQQELFAHKEAVAVRRAELVTEAQERAAAREVERQNIAARLRDLQFRESCDLLRMKQAKQRTAQIHHEQQDQAMAIQRQREDARKNDLEFDALAMSEDARNVARYEEDMRSQRNKYLELKAQLDAQLSAQQEQQRQGQQEHSAELQKLQQDWQREEEAAREAEKRARLQRQDLAANLHELNRTEQAKKAQEAKQLQDSEAKRLQAALQEEAEAEAKDRAAKLAKRNADVQYRAQLEASLKRQVDDTAERDELIEQANRAQQARKDAQKAAANAARAKLMSEVTQSRADQIQKSVLSKDMLVGERKVEHERLAQQHSEAEIKEAQEMERLRQEELRYRAELQKQMAEKQQRMAVEREQAARELEEAAKAEKVYTERANAALLATAPQADFRRKKIAWFT